jgi:hypothetical protein
MQSNLFHLVHSYTLELNSEQTIWDKTEVLLGISRGTTSEPHGNMMGLGHEQQCRI